jgi:hypothetical protein
MLMERKPRFFEKSLLIVTNQTHRLILLISFFEVKSNAENGGTAHQFIFVYFLISDIFRLENIWEY